MAVIDDVLAEQYAQLHAAGRFQGKQARLHTSKIKQMIDDTNSSYVLDYGCGKGHCYEGDDAIHKEWGVGKPRLYDPYYAPYSKRPEIRFHGVICTDVMEHVPEKDVDDVLKDIFSFAEKFVFLSISTKLAKKSLPDGRNAHLTVKPEEWWMEVISKHRPSHIKLHVEFVE